MTLGTGLALVSCFVLVFLASRSRTPVGGPTGVTWRPVFAEEFEHSADTVFSRGSWRFGWYGDGVVTDAVNRKETAGYARSLFTVEEDRGVFRVGPNHDSLSTGDGQPPNLGSILTTDPAQGARPGFTLGYGYVEARLQQPSGTDHEAVWPGFWLNGPDWPSSMEIDVIEGDGTDEGNTCNIHLGPAGSDVTNMNGTDRSTTVAGATAGMHTYAADIRPDGVTFYYDGVPVHSHAGPVPDARRYLVIGVSTSGHMSTTKSMLVDYVRAWVRSD